MPNFLSHQEQRDLVRWSLVKQARFPNRTNLDTHYLVPKEGIWNTYLRGLQTKLNDQIIMPQLPVDGLHSTPSGPRQLISNQPGSLIALESKKMESIPLPPPKTISKPITCTALLPKLRWANIGWFYHWGIKQYDFSRGKEEVDANIKSICKKAIKSVDWHELYKDSPSHIQEWLGCEPDDLFETYGELIYLHIDHYIDSCAEEPDAGIVNFYQTKDTLMGHVDRSELSETSPLISIS